MFNVSHIGDFKTSGLQTADTELDSVDGHRFDSETLDIGKKLGKREYTVWYPRLKFSIPREYHDRADDIRFQEIEEVTDSTDMLIILVYRILKFKPGPEQNLGPISVYSLGENPPLKIFGLDYKYPKSRYQNVVNLSCSSVLKPESDVVKEVVVRRTKPRFHFAR